MIANRGVWDVFGFGTFYNELSIQIVDICLGRSSLHGGLLPLEHVLAKVIETRGSKVDPIQRGDIRKAVAVLKPLKGGFQILTISNVEYIQCRPQSLSPDILTTIELFRKHESISEEEILAMLGWDRPRVELIIVANLYNIRMN